MHGFKDTVRIGKAARRNHRQGGKTQRQQDQQPVHLVDLQVAADAAGRREPRAVQRML